jgi:hypothetical protein
VPLPVCARIAGQIAALDQRLHQPWLMRFADLPKVQADLFRVYGMVVPLQATADRSRLIEALMASACTLRERQREMLCTCDAALDIAQARMEHPETLDQDTLLRLQDQVAQKTSERALLRSHLSELQTLEQGLVLLATRRVDDYAQQQQHQEERARQDVVLWTADHSDAGAAGRASDRAGLIEASDALGVESQRYWDWGRAALGLLVVVICIVVIAALVMRTP